MSQARLSFLADTIHSPATGGPDRGKAAGASLPVVLGVSIGGHVVLAMVLAALPTVGRLAGVPEDLLVAVDFFEVAPAAPEPVLEPEPPPEPPPVAALPRERRVVREVVPAPVPPPPAEEPAPVAAAVLPSVDDVFGAPPPPMESLTAPAGAGAFVVPAGEPGGVPGGRAGGVAGGRVGATGASVASAPPEVDGASRRRARDDYKRELERFLRDRMSYPRAAARERLEGRVELALRVGADGSLLGVRVASSSGYDLLDREAMATARDAGRMPAPPELCALRPSDELRVGVVYRLR